VPEPSPQTGSASSVSSRPRVIDDANQWTLQDAEALLCSLTGVLSARIIARPGGEIEEIHLLTTEAVSPKQTVRNVESALMAHFDVATDHRKISVAQTSRPMPEVEAWDVPVSLVRERVEPRVGDDRILFKGQSISSEGPHRVRVTVSVEWRGEPYEGTTTGPNLPRPRLEATAQATLDAVQAAANEAAADEAAPLVLALEGVREVDAFERRFILLSVHAMKGRNAVSLAGTAAIDGNPERAVVFAALEATDRWVRGKSL